LKKYPLFSRRYFN